MQQQAQKRVHVHQFYIAVMLELRDYWVCSMGLGKEYLSPPASQTS